MPRSRNEPGKLAHSLGPAEVDVGDGGSVEAEPADVGLILAGETEDFLGAAPIRNRHVANLRMVPHAEWG